MEEAETKMAELLPLKVHPVILKLCNERMLNNVCYHDNAQWNGNII